VSEVQATERILNRMTDPKEIEKRRQKKEEKKRVNNIKSRIGI
jgi:hypothetical protein